MNKIKFMAGCLACVFMLSCSQPTIEDDARKAAYLTHQSMEYSTDNELGAAESNYMEVQKIMDKYRYTEDFQQFHDLYSLYLDEYLENDASNLSGASEY
jgi:hypothetical protein